MGGAVAIEMALMRPARVSKLILCNALANYRTDTMRKWYEAKLQLGFVHLLGLRRTARFIARRLFPHDDQQPKRQRVIDVLGANPKRAYLQSIRALIGWSALDRLPDSAQKVLLAKRLSQKLHGAGLHGAHRHGDVGLARHENDGDMKFGPHQFALQVEAVQTW